MTETSISTSVPFVDLNAQYRAVEGRVDQAIQAVLENNDFILGRAVVAFEEEFATYCQTDHAVGVSSGLAALELILQALEIGPGDEVITAANTFIATALAISNVGATPVLVDADSRTYNMDPALVEAAVTPRTRALMPVHLYGQAADMDPLLEIARRHNLHVVEDACQSHGACYKGRRVGTLGHAAAFSFYPAKNLGAYGDGGMIVTNDSGLSERVRMLRNYGQAEKYHHVVKGSNQRLDTIQAAVLRIKLGHLDEWNQARRRHAALYNERLAGLSLTTPWTAPHAEHVFHLYIIQVERRDGLRAYLQEQGIASGIHYPIPVHLQTAYADLPYKHGDFPVSERLAEAILSLPMYPELTEAMIDHVAYHVRRFVQG